MGIPKLDALPPALHHRTMAPARNRTAITRLSLNNYPCLAS